MTELERTIEYTFKNEALLVRALTQEFAEKGVNVFIKASSQGFGYISWNRLYNELSGNSVSDSANAPKIDPATAL